MRTLVLSFGYVLTVLVAVFMDGYSFVMFAIASTGLGGFLLIRKETSSRSILLFAFPIHFISFLLAYIFYTNYVGVFDFESHSMEYFRGAGLDLAFIAIPTTGQHWILDFLGMSTARKASDYFGHFSSWTTTFSLPILIFGVVSWFSTRKKNAVSTALLILLLFSAYMSLGPSLKINSLKTPEDAARTSLPYMPAESAVMPTGNEVIYQLPGFKQMRLTFRWLALGIFCAWLLSIIYMASASEKIKPTIVISLTLILVINLPNVFDRNGKFVAKRDMFLSIDNDLIQKIVQVVEPESTVLFLPFRNDWMINYVAARAKIKTFNIGGDKNLRVARKSWPKSMIDLKYGELKYPQLLKPLLNGDTDYVLVTYFNSLTSSFNWPCSGAFKCPDKYRAEYAPILQQVENRTDLETVTTDLFTAIKITGNN